MRKIHQLSLGLAATLAFNAFAETSSPPGFRLKGTVVDTEGRPVAGATVETLITSRTRMPRFGEELEAGQRVVATNGSFELQLPGQGAVILARKPGFAPAWRQWRNLASDVEERISLTRPSTLAGIVVDEADKPIPNAEVSVSIAVMESELEGGGRTASYLRGQPARECFSARTSVEGRFRIEGFPTNAAADLRVQVPGKTLRQPLREYLDASSMQAHAGQEDIRLVVEPAGSVEGRIVPDVAGQPLPPARLYLQQEGPVFFGTGNRDDVESRADGTFHISDLAAGSYQLRAIFGTHPVPDWVAEAIPVVVAAGRTNGGLQITATRGGMLEVAVLGKKDRQPVAQVATSAFKPGYQTGADSDDRGKALLRMPPGAYQISASKQAARAEIISATVEAGKTNSVEIELAPPSQITGVVRKPDGQPAAGVAVRIVGGYGGYGGTMPKTDANGKFEIPFDPRQSGGPDRTFCLLARDPEHNLAVAQDIDEDTGPLDLRLAPAMTIAGRAESAGKPITNATAALVFWTGNTGMHLPGLALGTNIPGRFEIPALPPGRKYGLSVSAPGYGQKYVNAIDAETEPKRIELDPVELKPANLKLSGRVVDLDDKPVAGASVSLNGEGQPNGNTRTDLEGRFRFDRVCEGPVRLFANARSSQGNASAEGGDTNVVLKLGQSPNYGPNAKSHKLKGVVTDPDGKPVSGAQVAVFPSPSNRTKTGTDGAFSLTWVTQSWQSQAGSQPCLVARDLSRNLAVAEHFSEDTTNLDVQLEPALSVAGHVEDPGGNALGTAQVGVWLSASRTYSDINEQLARPDAEGNFEIKTLPVGQKYIVYATAKNHGRRQQDVTATYTPKRIDLPPFVLALADKMLAGQVVNAQDKPVSGVHVSFSGQDQAAESATTDSKGRFSFKVCEGSIRLFASGPTGSANVAVEAGDTNVVLQLGRNAVSSRVPASFSRNLTAFGLAADAAPAGKPLLLCLFDAEQPPSRRSARRLAERYDALREKGISVLGIQSGIIPAKAWQTWTNANPLPFPLGRAVDKSAGTKWVGQVESLPWLILRSARGAIAAEGFAIDDLDAKLKALKE